jgi:hypothetical protein
MTAHRGAVDLLLAALCVACYWGSLRGPWLLDDHVLIARNPLVRDAGNLARIWTSDYWAGADIDTGLYRPLPITTYALTYAVARGNTVPYHATNIALHALVTLLVWRVGMRGRRDLPTVACAALFAVHPVHAEAVANVVGRSELLVAAGFLVALAAHRRLAADSPAPPRRRAAWIAAEAAGAAVMLFSKETGAALLLYFLVEDSGTGRLSGRASRGRLAPGYLALCLAAACYALMRGAAVTGAMIGPHVDSLRGRLALGATAALKNAQMLVAPAGQRAVWPHPQLDAVPWWVIAAGILLVGAMAAATAAAARRATPARLGIALALVSSLLLLHPVPNTAWIWERGLYVPSIGLVWALHGILDAIPSRRGRSIAALAVLGLCVLYGAQTLRMDRVFSAEGRFWAHQVAADPRDSNALSSLAAVRRKEGGRAAGLALQSRAYEAEPRRAPVVAAYASMLLEDGDTTRASEVLTSASLARLDFHHASQSARLLRSLEQLARAVGAARAADAFAVRAVRRARAPADAYAGE